MRVSLLAFCSVLMLAGSPARAETPDFELRIKDHRFVPSELEIPANTKVKLKVINEDPTPAEFESHDFNREKIIKGGQSALINVGPLKPGRYAFFEEFHPETGQGALIVK